MRSQTIATDIVIRAFDPVADMAAAARLIFTANEHDNVDWRPTETTLAEEWQPSERFDPASDVILAWSGDELAGSVMTFIWPEENEAMGIRRAWLEHLSVRRPWRRMGLASALIADTLRMLREMGMEDAVLGVHGENPTGAVGVYERAGFAIHRRWVLWRKPLLDGAPRVT